LPFHRSADGLPTKDLWGLVKEHKALKEEAGLEFQKQVETNPATQVLLEELNPTAIQALKWDDFKAILNTLESTKPAVQTSFETKLDVFAK
jgi:hypothetical protein